MKTLCLALILGLTATTSAAQVIGTDHIESAPLALGVLSTPAQAGCNSSPCPLNNISLSPSKANSTTAAASPLNSLNLLAVSDNYDCNTLAGIYVSTDGGLTWTGSCFQFYLATGDPVLSYGSELAYIAGANASFSGCGGCGWVATSTDNGLSWSEPIAAARPLQPSGLTNAPAIQVDNSAGSPFLGSVYLSVTQFDAQVVESEISVSHSTDSGNTWVTTTVDPIQYKPIVDQDSRMAIGADGTVYVAWQRCAMTGPNINCADTDAQMLLSKSTDGGNTWSTPVVIATVHLVPDTCDCAFFGNLPLTNEPVSNMPVLGIDNSHGPHAGNLYAVMYTWNGTQMRTMVATSSDGGNTWAKPVVVAPAKHDQFFASLSVSPSGMVGVSWLDRRNDPLNVSYQPYAAASLNGGASFSKSYPVTTFLSDPYLDGNGGTYMGDYTGNTWAGNNYFLVTWPDSRNLQFMQDYIGGFRIK